MKRIIVAAALAAAAVAAPAAPASAEHPLCTHRELVDFILCQLHPVTDLLGDGGS